VADLWKNSSSSGGGDDVERVKDACDIVRIIGENVALKAKGREYVCLCPFHDDHNPSMRVIPSKQIFHCFVCGTGGDVFSFVQKFHKMEFFECLQFLAEKSGVTLSPRKRRDGGSGDGGDGQSPQVSRKQLLDANAGAAAFYRAILRHPEHGKAAREVIARRGISDAMVELFQIGAAPDKWDGLLLKANAQGWSETALFEAGLLKRRDSGGCYDLLRNRLLFPIHDKAARVVAFGGRKIKEEDEPKYLNSPETRLFNKSATLYALHLASRKIQAEKTVLVTEGYMDVIACHQAGFTNAVATLGTALTREHAAMVRPMCDTVILLFDGDDAGQRAADRAVPIFFAEPIDVKIATLAKFTDAKDPDELLKREGGDAIFRRVLAGSIDLLEYRFDRVREKLKGAGVSALSKALLSEIESMVEMGLRDVEPIRQRLIVKRLAELGGLDEETIRRAIPAGRSDRRGASGAGAAADESSETDTDTSQEPSKNLATARLTSAEHMLGCLLCDGGLWAAMGESEKDMLTPRAFEDRPVKHLAQCILDIGEDGSFPSLEMLLRATDDEQVKSAAVCLASRVEAETERNPTRLHSHWRACVQRVRQDAKTQTEADLPVQALPAESFSAEPKPTGTDAHSQPLAEVKASSVIAKLMERQRLHNAHGADRRVLPNKR